MLQWRKRISRHINFLHRVLMTRWVIMKVRRKMETNKRILFFATFTKLRLVDEASKTRKGGNSGTSCEPDLRRRQLSSRHVDVFSRLAYNPDVFPRGIAQATTNKENHALNIYQHQSIHKPSWLKKIAFRVPAPADSHRELFWKLKSIKLEWRTRN